MSLSSMNRSCALGAIGGKQTANPLDDREIVVRPRRGATNFRAGDLLKDNGMSAAQIAKLERQLKKVDDEIRDVLTRPHDDPLWADEKFWNGRWLAMIDRSGELVDRIIEVRRKDRESAT